jgi:hypothetical protein
MMKQHPVDLDHPRFPVWERPDLLAATTTGSALLDTSNEVIRPLAGDPPVVYSHTNYHTLFLGPQRLLHDEAGEFVRRVQGQFDFDANSPWQERRGMIEGLIRSFFPEDSQGLGTLSITPMRRPAPYRAEDDRRIQVTSPNPSRFAFVNDKKIHRRWDPKVRLGGWEGCFHLPLAGLPFACAAGSRTADNRLAKIMVQRQLRATGFRLQPGQEHYRETWLCQACPGADDARLSRGHIPAIPLDSCRGNALRVRTTPILTLLKIDLAAPVPWCQMLAIEMDAAAGGLFLSVRHSSLPWSVLLLVSSSVEHIGVCQTLRKLVR